METSMELYLEAVSIVEDLPGSIDKLSWDISKRRDILWMDNPYIPSDVYYEIIESLSQTKRREFYRKQQQTVIPNRTILREEDVIKIIDCEYEYLMSIDQF